MKKCIFHGTAPQVIAFKKASGTLHVGCISIAVKPFVIADDYCCSTCSVVHIPERRFDSNKIIIIEIVPNGVLFKLKAS